MNFRVGQKVFCIKRGSWTNPLPTHISPEYGDILTIREMGVSREDGETYLRFVEIKNPDDCFPVCFNDGEPCYWEGRFRPLIETDISIFQAILANPHKELEDA